MKIKLSEPEGPYSCVIDTEVMDVDITEAFIGYTHTSLDGESISVCQRDSGFEATYVADGRELRVSFQSGEIDVVVVLEDQ